MMMVVHLFLWAYILGWCSLTQAGTLQHDPKGFHDIVWGSPLGGRPDVEAVKTGEHITEYRLKSGAPIFEGIPVESIRLSAVDEQFARVTIRYQGDLIHKQIMTSLEQRFGPVERLPGQMMRGLNQQYNWRGTETEINVTYQANTERGFLFIDSRTMAPRFNDYIADTAD